MPPRTPEFDLNTHSPYHDEDFDRISMALDPKGSWVHVNKARALQRKVKDLQLEHKHLGNEYGQMRALLVAWTSLMDSGCVNNPEYAGKIYKDTRNLLWGPRNVG